MNARLAVLILSTCLGAQALAATTTTVVDIPAPSGGTQRFLYLRPDAPAANIISLSGTTASCGKTSRIACSPGMPRAWASRRASTSLYLSEGNRLRPI